MSITSITKRIDQICNLLKELDGSIEGRKRFQKIVFIASNLGQLPYEYRDFNWNYYGVYSYELANDIDIAERLKYLKEEEFDYTYKYELTDEGRKLTDILKLNEELKFLFTEKDARFLEVLSSIFYFARKYNDDEKIRDILLKFKGHLSSYFNDAFNTYHELKKVA